MKNKAFKNKAFNYVSSTKDHKAREICRALRNANLYKMNDDETNIFYATYLVHALVYDLMQLLNTKNIKYNTR